MQRPSGWRSGPTVWRRGASPDGGHTGGPAGEDGAAGLYPGTTL